MKGQRFQFYFQAFGDSSSQGSRIFYSSSSSEQDRLCGWLNTNQAKTRRPESKQTDSCIYFDYPIYN